MENILKRKLYTVYYSKINKKYVAVVKPGINMFNHSICTDMKCSYSEYEINIRKLFEYKNVLKERGYCTDDLGEIDTVFREVSLYMSRYVYRRRLMTTVYLPVKI